MRGSTDAGLTSPFPIGATLPAMFHDDEFAQRFVAGFDDVLAPVFSALDNLPAYLDPRLAPPDFLDFLSSWVALALDAGWPEERRREVVLRAVSLWRWRGTARGLVEELTLLTGVEPEVCDSGGVAWAETPGGAEPPSGPPGVVVRLPAEAEGVDRARLEAAVAAAVPAHVPFRLEVLSS